MGCLVELHNQKFLGVGNLREYTRLIETHLLRVEDFGRRVHGKHSVNIYIRKGAHTEQIVRYAKQVDRLLISGAIDELVIDSDNKRFTLTRPLLVDIAGTANFYEPEDPLILKYLCEDFRRRMLKGAKPTYQDIVDDQEYPVPRPEPIHFWG